MPKQALRTLLAIMTGLLLAAAPASAETYYKIQNRLTGYFLDISGRSRSDGAPLISWHGNGDSNQLFRIVRVGGGNSFLVPAHSGKNLYAQKRQQAKVVQSSSRTWWRLVKQRNGYYKIYYADSNLCMDVTTSRRAGSKVILWPAHNAPQQEFRLFKAYR